MSADYEIRRLEQKLSNLEFDKDAELAALRTRIAELEKRNREIESYHLNHLGIPCDMTDPDIAVLQARIAELEADALARLIEEPTNERIMKDVYDENERLKARIAELEAEREWQWKNDALDDVLKERQRQEEKWGEQNHNPYIYLAILVEEVGELAQAILHTQFGGSHQGLEEVRKEAIHCAAVGLAVIECLDRKKWQVGDVKFDHLLPKPPEEK